MIEQARDRLQTVTDQQLRAAFPAESDLGMGPEDLRQVASQILKLVERRYEDEQRLPDRVFDRHAHLMAKLHALQVLD